jgi:NADPH-dependent curcumin reductase CurA
VGGTVGEVVASRNPNFAVGDIAVGYGGWQDYAVANGSVGGGRVKYREDVFEGLENVPAAFLGLLQGKNFGNEGASRPAPDLTASPALANVHSPREDWSCP